MVMKKKKSSQSSGSRKLQPGARPKSRTLSRLATRILKAKTAKEGITAIANLADRWSDFAQHCSGQEASRIAASFEVGVTCAHALARGEADEQFWRQQFRNFK